MLFRSVIVGFTAVDCHISRVRTATCPDAAPAGTGQVRLVPCASVVPLVDVATSAATIDQDARARSAMFAVSVAPDGVMTQSLATSGVNWALVGEATDA